MHEPNEVGAPAHLHEHGHKHPHVHESKKSVINRLARPSDTWKR